jgi:hypothetical protein
MPNQLELALKAVVDEVTFVSFLEELAADFSADAKEAAAAGTSPYGAGPRGWQNGTVDQFLECAASWSTDAQGRFRTSGNPWQRCAQILYMGKLYE